MIHAVVLHHDRAAIIELPQGTGRAGNGARSDRHSGKPERIWIQDEDGRPVRIQLFFTIRQRKITLPGCSLRANIE